MAEITATLRDNSGNAKVGWTVQFRLSAGGAVVSTTADGTIDDKGNGSYVSNNSPAAGEYDVYACESGGTPALIKGYDNIRHVEFPLPEDMGGTGLTSLSGLGAAAGLEIGVDVQEYSDRLQTLVASVEAFNIANQDAIPVYAQAGDVCSFVNVAAARTLMNLDDSNGARESLGLAIGTDVQEQSAILQTLHDDISANTGVKFININNAVSSLETASDTRDNLGLGTAAVENWDTEIDNLVAIPSDLGGLDGFVVHESGVGIAGATPAEARTMLGLTDSNGSRQLLGVEIGVDVQAYSSKLTTLASNIADTPEDPGFLVVNGAGVDPDIVSASSARTHLGLGTSATVDTTISGEANKVVKVAPKGAIVVPMSDGTITAAANTLGNIFQVLTGDTTTGTYRVDMVVITGVSGGNYTYGFETLYSASWGGA